MYFLKDVDNEAKSGQLLSFNSYQRHQDCPSYYIVSSFTNRLLSIEVNYSNFTIYSLWNK